MRNFYVPKWSRDYLEEAYKTMSLREIADKNNTYAKAIQRALEYYGIPLKSKSQAQKEALNRGVSKNPKGKNDS